MEDSKPARTASLPADRAFVVQLRVDADPEQHRILWCIEHLASSEAASFETLTDLGSFLAQVLLRLSPE